METLVPRGRAFMQNTERSKSVKRASVSCVRETEPLKKKKKRVFSSRTTSRVSRFARDGANQHS